MKIEPNSDRARLADLYRRSGTVQFRPAKISAHKTNPGLPPSPIYLHFPEKGKPGYDLVEEIEELAAQIFFDMIREHGLGFRRLAAVPKGAQGVATKLAKLLDYWYNDLLLVFDKEERDGDNYFFGPIEGEYEVWDNVLGIEDHTSGGHNKALFVEAISRVQLELFVFLNIVDRQQGGVAFLHSLGIDMYSIFTLDELLNYYVEFHGLEQAKADDVRLYIANNQLWVPPEP